MHIILKKNHHKLSCISPKSLLGDLAKIKLAVVSAMSRPKIQHALCGDIILCKTTFKRLDIIFARILKSTFNNDLICYFCFPFSYKLTLSCLISLTRVLVFCSLPTLNIS